MNLDDLKIEKHEVKDRLVVIRGEDLSDQQMMLLAQKLKKAGAIEVVVAYGDTKFETLSKEDLVKMGLKLIGDGEGPKPI